MANHKEPPASPDPMDDELPDAELEGLRGELPGAELEEIGEELGRMYHHETLAYGRSLDRVYARLQELDRTQPPLSPVEEQLLSVPAPTSPSSSVSPEQTLKAPAQISTGAQQSPRRPVTALETAWRTLAAVLVVALLGTGFFALLHGIPRPGAHSKPTRTPIPTTSPASSPTVPAYFLPTAPLLPAGWTWYRNGIGHFEVPLAPGWRAGSYYSTVAGVSNCAYDVQFFPPGAGGSAGNAQATFAPRLIEISENFSCPPSSWSSTPDQPYIVREPNPAIVDGQPVVIWDNVTAPGEVDDFADATFHGHQFGFAVQSRDSNFILVDAKVFHQMLHGFKYTGLTLSCAEPSTILACSACQAHSKTQMKGYLSGVWLWRLKPHLLDGELLSGDYLVQ